MNTEQQEVSALTDKPYASLTPEELEARFRETFFFPDRIDETVIRELEALRAALEEKQPEEEAYDPEEAWERFLEDNAEELAELWGPERGDAPEPADRAAGGKKAGGFPALLRAGLIAAAVFVLLVGAALAAGPQLWAWVRGWSSPLEPKSTGSPIQQAMKDLGITEPLYPSWLPSGYALTEAHISEDPPLLYEMYTREDRYISITITPVTAVEKARYSQEDQLPEEYRAGEMAHYLYSNGGYVTAVWYTDNYFVSINGNIYTRALKRIVDSVYAS